MFCKKCGNQMDGPFCQNCGTGAEGETTQNPMQQPANPQLPIVPMKRKKNLKVVIIIFCACTGMSVLAGILGTNSLNKDIKQVQSYVEKQEYSSAETILKKQLSTNPSFENVYIAYSDFYIVQDQYLNALDILNTGIKNATSTDELKTKVNEIRKEYAAEIAKEQTERDETQKREEAEKRERKEAEKREEEELLQQAKEAESSQAEVAKEEYIASCQSIDYETLSRNPDSYDGKALVFEAQVFQVIEPTFGNTVTLMLNVTKGEYGIWNDIVYATVNLPTDADRILKDDIIQIYGDCKGLHSYETVLGVKSSVPRIDIKYFDQAK